ncbi:MAG: 1,4-alpha-glucan branching protein GlgB [Clostridiales bacterium]|nr:1,4-alpha-glucan branching protein GlgB [Clostridiales bacterium]
MEQSASIYDVHKIVNACHSDPFSVLGIHEVSSPDATKRLFAIRSFMPNAKDLYVIKDNKRYLMEKIHPDGFFEVFLTDTVFFSYKFEITDYNDYTFDVVDPYSFLPVISDYDLYLFNEGNNYKIYEKLGAHICTINNVVGTLFAVWAPSAKNVSVVGSFNQWDGRRNPMRYRGKSGVWELFIPYVTSGELYKFEIRTSDNQLLVKSDPFANYSELRPKTASIVYDLDNYNWSDASWIYERDSKTNFRKPISIYEVHLGSWQKPYPKCDSFLSYRDLADKLVSYVKNMGYTHIELMPISEYPFDGSWGYQVTGYYSVTSRYGTPTDFKYFVDVCHNNNIGVILDWVPAHFPKDEHGLAKFDGSCLFEHCNSKQGEHPDWGTLIFNFGRHEVKNFLIANALFWFDKYHIDGLRVDAVASMLYLDYGKKDGEWIPNKWGGKENVEAIDFLRHLNSICYKYFPGIMMMAEESTSWAMVTKPTDVGGLGFSYKWNMGWMNDFLQYLSFDPIYRKYHHNLLTFSMVYAYSENFILVLSHDEVVHQKGSMINKMPGDYWQKFAGLRACYGFMFCHPGKKLLFMGNDFAQFDEWNYTKSLDWHLLKFEYHNKINAYIKDLNFLYRSQKSLHEVDFTYDGFEWIDCNDNNHSVICFIRKALDCNDFLIIICNFTPMVYNDYRIGLPKSGHYHEIFCSDDDKYGGSGVCHPDGIWAEDVCFHNRPFSAKLSVPPLAISIFKPD